MTQRRMPHEKTFLCWLLACACVAGGPVACTQTNGPNVAEVAIADYETMKPRVICLGMMPGTVKATASDLQPWFSLNDQHEWITPTMRTWAGAIVASGGSVLFNVQLKRGASVRSDGTVFTGTRLLPPDATYNAIID